ncbi:MAG TPA: NAD-dependent epimerase/dehydratase family protein [Xanthobacteraceae bacterium]
MDSLQIKFVLLQLPDLRPWPVKQMPRHAFILGGTGQIGRAVAGNLIDEGWRVTIAHRGAHPLPSDLLERGVEVALFDREKSGELARAVGSGTDALIDTIAFGLHHARQLIEIEQNVGTFVVISSSSVYRDALGKTLDEAPQNGFPDLPMPIAETQPTVEPGPMTYSTRKVMVERALLDDAKTPVTVLRPGAIHGPGPRLPREWWFVKRILDGRKVIPLAYRGTSRFHTTSVANIAQLTRVVIEVPASRVLNIADPSAPSVTEIAAFISQHMGYRGLFLEVVGEDYPPVLGRTPWSVPRPYVLDTRAAAALGYAPATTYSDAVRATCDWLVETAPGEDW